MAERHDRALQCRLSLGRALALGSLRGLWTLEQLDQPSGITRGMQAAIERAHLNRGQQPPEYRNLAREWIAANAAEFDELLRQSLEAETLDHLPTGAEILAAAAGSGAGAVSLAQSRF